MITKLIKTLGIMGILAAASPDVFKIECVNPYNKGTFEVFTSTLPVIVAGEYLMFFTTDNQEKVGKGKTCIFYPAGYKLHTYDAK